MNKTKLIWAAVLLFTASCANEDVSKETESDRQNNQVLTTFTSGDAPATRTTIDYTVGGTGKFFWELGDNIFVTDDSGTPVASTSSTIAGKTDYAKFQVPGTFTSTSYAVYYTGKNSTHATSVTIAANQTQSAPNDFSHLSTSGDCGTATATGSGSEFAFKLKHQAAYLCLLPRSTNPLIAQFVIESVSVTADKDIAGDFALASTGLAATPTANGSKTITVSTPDLALTNATSPATNAVYVVMAPQTTALNIVYHLKNTATGMTGTVSKNIPTQAFEANKIYDLTSNLGHDYSEEMKPYMWDAKKWYYDGKTAPYNYPADAPQSKATDPDRWFNDEFTLGTSAIAQNSCKDCPTAIQLTWYCCFYPYYDENELYTVDGKVYKGVTRLKKWAYLVADHGASLTAIPTTVPPNANAWDATTGTPGYTGDIIPNASHFNVDAGLPAPAEMKKYFALPYTYDHLAINEQGAYWASTGSPQAGQFPPNPSAAYICFGGNILWVSTGYYIERPRTYAYYAVKFE